MKNPYLFLLSVTSDSAQLLDIEVLAGVIEKVPTRAFGQKEVDCLVVKKSIVTYDYLDIYRIQWYKQPKDSIRRIPITTIQRQNNFKFISSAEANTYIKAGRSFARTRQALEQKMNALTHLQLISGRPLLTLDPEPQ